MKAADLPDWLAAIAAWGLVDLVAVTLHAAPGRLDRTGQATFVAGLLG